MILVDTSVWIDHFRYSDAQLVSLLNQSRVLMHPFVLGELACGNLANRAEILDLLANMPRLPVMDDAFVLSFIEQHALTGKGIGYVDVHLLASVAEAHIVTIWTRDKRLAKVAEELSLTC